MKKLLFLLLLPPFANSTSAQSLLFNGSSSYVTLGNSPSFRLTAFTLEAWIKTGGTGSSTNSGKGGIVGCPIIAKGRGEADAPASLNTNYLLAIDGSNKLVVDFEESSGRNHPIKSKSIIPANTWTHVAVTYEPAAALWKLYINGLPDTARDIGNNIFPVGTANQAAAIGSALNSRNTPDGYFKGSIDEVRIWNIVRSSAEIRQYYKSELESGTGLIARYALNEGSGTAAINSAITSNNGTLINMPVWTTGFNNSASIINAGATPPNGSNVSAASATLKVTVSDANNDKLRVRFYGRKKVTKEKFSIVLIPDTQFYTAEPQGKNGGNNAMFKSQMAWIARNRATKNIVYAGQLGDCVENGDRYETEWKRADTAIRTIESSNETGLVEGLPYGICVGNHDQMPFGNPQGSTTLYNKYFGAARFAGRPYYGGHSGTNNDNHYQVFSGGGIDFLVLCPEYDQTKGFAAAGGALDWMEGIIKNHPTHKIIVLSHHVLAINSTFTTQGAVIYQRLKQYPNFILMSGGHVTQGDGESRRSDTYNGRTVHTLTSDYQTRTKGGNGLLRIYEFDPLNNTLTAQTYSPYTDMFETDTNSSFVLQTNLSTPSKPYVLIKELIGLKPGGSASVAWPVEQNKAYEWYVSVFDGERTTKSPAYSFTTNYTVGAMTSSKAKEAAWELPATATSNKLFIAYPNPVATNEISLSFLQKASGQAILSIYNVSGTLCYRQAHFISGNIISLKHNLANGIYTVTVQTGTGTASQKLIIVKK